MERFWPRRTRLLELPYRAPSWARLLSRLWLLVAFNMLSCGAPKSGGDPASASPAPPPNKTNKQITREFPSESVVRNRAPLHESAHCLFGCPEPAGRPACLLLDREIFALCNNSATKFADFVAYQVTKNTIGRSKPRKWKPDPDLPADATLEPDDYRGAHAALSTDRGHQVPLASFSGTRDYRMLNYLSNVTPQRGALNQRAWKYLEEAERRLAQEDGTSGVYVITGPLYERDMPQLPNADEPHRVPSGYFKVVALRSGEGAVVEAFVFDQDTPSTANYCEHLVLVDEVERRAGFDFFVGVPDAEEERLEGEPGQLGVRLGCK